MDKSNTFGLVFLKGHAKKLIDLNKAVKKVYEEHASEGSKPEVKLALACGGYFDCVLLISSETIEQIGKFVIEGLRQNHPDVIADTQTFVCWRIS